MQLSLDGYVGGLNGELDWMQWNWDDGLKKCVKDITEPVDLIVIGRKLAEGFIPHWTNAAKDPATADVFAKKMADTPKLVFSNTSAGYSWENSRLAREPLREEIERVKKSAGGDIITYGGATLAAALIEQKLINDLYLFVNPVAIGKGLPILREELLCSYKHPRHLTVGCYYCIIRFNLKTTSHENKQYPLLGNNHSHFCI